MTLLEIKRIEKHEWLEELRRISEINVLVKGSPGKTRMAEEFQQTHGKLGYMTWKILCFPGGTKPYRNTTKSYYGTELSWYEYIWLIEAEKDETTKQQMVEELENRHGTHSKAFKHILLGKLEIGKYEDYWLIGDVWDNVGAMNRHRWKKSNIIEYLLMIREYKYRHGELCRNYSSEGANELRAVILGYKYSRDETPDNPCITTPKKTRLYPYHISSRVYHSVLVTAASDNMVSWRPCQCWTAGSNHYGQLGRTTEKWFDDQLAAISEETVKRAETGWGSSALIDGEGNVSTCGANYHGQLGRPGASGSHQATNFSSNNIQVKDFKMGYDTPSMIEDEGVMVPNPEYDAGLEYSISAGARILFKMDGSSLPPATVRFYPEGYEPDGQFYVLNPPYHYIHIYNTLGQRKPEVRVFSDMTDPDTFVSGYLSDSLDGVEDGFINIFAHRPVAKITALGGMWNDNVQQFWNSEAIHSISFCWNHPMLFNGLGTVIPVNVTGIVHYRDYALSSAINTHEFPYFFSRSYLRVQIYARTVPINLFCRLDFFPP